MRRRIAIVGSGISGSLCARLLATQHHVTLFESANRVGGHTHTIEVEAFGQRWPVDTGFMVFNDRTYPNFQRMLELLQVDSRDSDMSFSVCCPRTQLEYQGSSLNGLFAQRRNLLRPSFYRLLSGIGKFNRLAQSVLDGNEPQQTLGQWIQRDGLVNQDVLEKYLLPMTAAIWSAPPQAMMEFPVYFLARFLENHGLLQVFDRPQWMTIPGGAKRYLDRLLHPLGDSVRTDSQVASVKRLDHGVELTLREGPPEIFDSVIFATHAPQTLEMLANPTALEVEVLSQFKYQPNEAFVHCDTMVLPKRRRAWASWNYRLASNSALPASVTYDLSRLQGHASPQPILQTLNPSEPIDPSQVLSSLKFEHPLFTTDTIRAQEKHEQLHEQGQTYYCGAYWRNGFHEDGVVSALTVCKHFNINLEHLTNPCIAASTKVASNT